MAKRMRRGNEQAQLTRQPEESVKEYRSRLSQLAEKAKANGVTHAPPVVALTREMLARLPRHNYPRRYHTSSHSTGSEQGPAHYSYIGQGRYAGEGHVQGEDHERIGPLTKGNFPLGMFGNSMRETGTDGD